LTTDFVILATGQRPNNSLIEDLIPSDGDTLINPNNGFVRVRRTLQFLDSKYPNLFAVGDIADTGMHKAARPGAAQAAVAARNTQALIEGKEPQEHFNWSPAGIHLSLGLVSATEYELSGKLVSHMNCVLIRICRLQKRNILFRNPNIKEGQTDPNVTFRDEYVYSLSTPIKNCLLTAFAV
jgi:NADH dehydrogenase FAD-containing subunit